LKTEAIAPKKKRRKKATNPVAMIDVDRMNAYVNGLATGSIPACRHARLAAQRHLTDLERAKTDAFPYFFDEDQAARFFRFSRLLKHVKGDISGQPLVMHEWGLLFLGQLFGWRVKGTGSRRFRKAMAWIPRGNSKSTYLSAAVNYAAFAEGGQADAFALGVKRDQAGIVWGDGAAMLRGSPELLQSLGVQVRAHDIVQPRTNSSFKPLASESKSLDGLNVAVACLDELHEVPRSLGEVIDTALGKRANSVRISISTAGMNTSSYGYEQYRYCRDVLEGNVVDDMTLAVIFEMPEGMDPYSPEAQRAANPMYGQSVRPEILAMAAEQARRLSGSRAGYLVKHLGLWQDTHNPWMDMARFDSCMDPSLRLEDFVGRPCVIGLDLAERQDLCAKALVFPSTREDGSKEYVVFVKTYLHETGIASSANDSFRAWSLEGHLKATPGDVTDLRQVMREVVEDSRAFYVTEVAIDRYYGNLLSQDLAEEGLTVVEVPQTVQHLSPAMKETEAAVFQGRFRWAPNPVLRHCVANVVARVDANDNVFPRREKTTRPPIDAASAVFNAIARAAAGTDLAYTDGTGLREV
jgi:phage terminase large subunit-like protein